MPLAIPTRPSSPLKSVHSELASIELSQDNNNNASSNMTEPVEARPRKLIPVSQPISVLPTDIARLYTHLHPIVILTVYYFCFPYLVNDPVPVLSKAIAPLAHLQITYCVVCLPQSSGSSTPPSTSSKSPTARKRVQFAQSTKSKPASVRSRITVCYNSGFPPLPRLRPQSVLLTFRYPPNEACRYLPTPLPLPFGPAVDGHSHSFRCSSDYPFLAQSTMCNAHLTAGRPASVLRTRRQRAHVEGNIRSLSTI